jgi:putative CocE/NonD family hydrolase
MTQTISIEYDVAVPMRDETVLRADVYRPDGPGPFPVLLARTPYGKSEVGELAFLDPWLAARQGFLTVVQDVRGRYASDGAWQPLAHEGPDGYDTVEWAARLPQSNGRVGMWGLSYLGNVQWQAAQQHPPSLAAIAPRFTWRDPADGLVGRGGALEHGVGVWWTMLTGLDVVMRRHGDDPDTLGERLVALVGDLDGLEETYRELPAGSPPIHRRHELPALATAAEAGHVTATSQTLSIPSLNIAGWFDVFAQGPIDNYVANAARAQLLIGPWNHVDTSSRQGDVDFGFAANDYAINLGPTLHKLTLDWLAQQLTGQPAATLTPPVRIFVMGADQWRDEQEWPLARAVPTDWFLSADGTLSTVRPDGKQTAGFRYDPEDPVPTCGGAIYLAQRAGMLDQAAIEARSDVLVFTSEPLAQDFEVTGPVAATLTVSTDVPTTDWIVRLCDVDEHGISRNVTDGVVRDVAPAGEVRRVDVDLWSTSMLFRAGHRLRVQVTSSCFPRWDRNLGTLVPTSEAVQSQVAHQTLHLGTAGACSLRLPVVPGPA